MKIDVEEMAPCVRRLSIEVPADSVNRELEKVYRDLQRRIRLPGFRPGKVPRRILENHYRHTVEQEVMQKLVPEALSEALIKENLHAVGEPQIDQMVLHQGQPLQFISTVQIIPAFQLVDHHDWEFERRITQVTDADVDAALERLRERHAALLTVAGRPVQQGDFVILDYQGFLHDAPLADMQGTNAVVEVGGEVALPEIEQGLLGMMQGEEKLVTLQLPEGFQDENLAGQQVECRIRVNEIKEKSLPVVDDEFAQSYEGMGSLAALRQRVRDDLQRLMRQQADEVLRSQILARLVAENPIEVPDQLVQEQMRRLYLRQQRQESGRELSEEDMQIDPDTLREEFGEPALEAVRGQVLLQRLGEEAGVTVTEAEVDAEVAALAARAAQNPEALKQAMHRNGALRLLESGVRERKIFDAIMADMQIVDTMMSADDMPSEASARE